MGCETCPEENTPQDEGCQCDGHGYCPVYNLYMGKANHEKCKNSATWRENFRNFYGTPSSEVDMKERQKIHDEAREAKKKQEQIHQAMKEIEAAGITEEDIKEGKEGVGDVVHDILAKFGVTPDTVEEWLGIDGGCGCEKRANFLNKILPFKLWSKERK